MRKKRRYRDFAGVVRYPFYFRLDRGGDRQLNRALHTLIVSRRKHHQPTIAYIDRRVSEGKNPREAIRCLKRYLARQLFRLLEQMPQHA